MVLNPSHLNGAKEREHPTLFREDVSDVCTFLSHASVQEKTKLSNTFNDKKGQVNNALVVEKNGSGIYRYDL